MKKCLNYTISPIGTTSWQEIKKDGKHFAKAIDEEEARRVIWMDTGCGGYITDKTMETV